MACYDCGILTLQMDGEFIDNGRAPYPPIPPEHLYRAQFSPPLSICHNSTHTFRASIAQTTNYILRDPKWTLIFNRHRNGVLIDSGVIPLTNTYTPSYGPYSVELIQNFNDPRLNFIAGDKVTLTLSYSIQSDPAPGANPRPPECTYIAFDMPINYKYCTPCGTACKEQSVNIPGDVGVAALTTIFGGILELKKPYDILKCRKVGSGDNNYVVAAKIKALIDARVECNPVALNVFIDYNYTGRLCLKMRILNSPIVFNNIIMSDGTRYTFNNANCEKNGLI